MRLPVSLRALWTARSVEVRLLSAAWTPPQSGGFAFPGNASLGLNPADFGPFRPNRAGKDVCSRFGDGSGSSVGRKRPGGDAEDLPLVGNALQLAVAEGLEVDAGAGGKVADGARGEDLSRAGQGRDPRGDVDGDAADILADQLNLAAVQSGPHLDPQ